MAETGWYEIVQGDVPLAQGDILFSFPVPVVAELPWPIPPDHRPAVDIHIYDFIILTQSCDLANDKVAEVLLAQIVDWQTYAQAQQAPHFKGTDFRRALVAGNIPGLSLLHKRGEEPRLPWSIVNFHRLFTVPRLFINQVAAGGGSRLRLRSPYREHLAQAFARYFMRVGLPHDAKAFIEEGKVK